MFGGGCLDAGESPYSFIYEGGISTTITDTLGKWPLTIQEGEVTSVTGGNPGNCIQTGAGGGRASTAGNFTPLVSIGYFELEWDAKSAVAIPANVSSEWMVKFVTGGSCLSIVGNPSAGGGSIYVEAFKASRNNCRNAYSNAFALSNAAWKHFKVVFDGSQSVNENRVKLYVNGSFVGRISGTDNLPAVTTDSTGPFMLWPLLSYGLANSRNIQMDNITFRTTPS